MLSYDLVTEGFKVSLDGNTSTSSRPSPFCSADSAKSGARETLPTSVEIEPSDSHFRSFAIEKPPASRIMLASCRRATRNSGTNASFMAGWR